MDPIMEMYHRPAVGVKQEGLSEESSLLLNPPGDTIPGSLGSPLGRRIVSPKAGQRRADASNLVVNGGVGEDGHRRTRPEDR